MRNELFEALNSCCGNINIEDFTPIVWGCGNTSMLYQNAFEREKIEPFAYADNNTEKQKSGFMGKRVLCANDLIALSKDKSIKPVMVLINSSNPGVVKALEEQLDNISLKHITVDKYLFFKNSDKILKAYDLLSDDTSKFVYETVILGRLNNENIDPKLICDNQYFALPEFSIRSSDEIFVDFGAFVGDSAERYIWERMGVFKKIYAFETDERNFNAMCCRVDRLKREWAIGDDKIELVKAGIGRETRNASFTTRESDNSSLGASLTKCDTNFDSTVKIYSVDDYFKNKNISFLKADIESYEYDMLLGAENTIKKCKPKIAVCIYHNASDMYSIPLLISSFNPEYKFAVRHHYSDFYSETVLYAY